MDELPTAESLSTELETMSRWFLPMLLWSSPFWFAADCTETFLTILRRWIEELLPYYRFMRVDISLLWMREIEAAVCCFLALLTLFVVFGYEFL